MHFKGGVFLEEQKAKNNNKKEFFEWLDVIVTSVLAVVLIFTFLFRIVSIDGDSMKNTLLNKERVVISNLFYTPKNGDIVVISRNTDNSLTAAGNKAPIIKRVIAVEGQTVDIKDGYVFVDGEKLHEPYTKDFEFDPASTTDLYDVTFPLTVEPDCIFVLGDNRHESLDSRSSVIGQSGQVNVKYVLGKAIFRIFPFNKLGGI